MKNRNCDNDRCREAFCLHLLKAVSAIRNIENNWENGDLAKAVRYASEVASTLYDVAQNVARFEDRQSGLSSGMPTRAELEANKGNINFDRQTLQVLIDKRGLPGIAGGKLVWVKGGAR